MTIRVATKDDLNELEPLMRLPWVVAKPGEDYDEKFYPIETAFDRRVIVYCTERDDKIISLLVFNPQTRFIEVSAVDPSVVQVRVTIKIFDYVREMHPGTFIYAETYTDHYDMNKFMDWYGFAPTPHPLDSRRFAWRMLT